VSEQHRAGAIGYWVLAVVLVAFGYLSLFSMGAPFVLTGLAMIVVGRWRRNPAVVWPALIGVWAFVVGYVLAAPLGCTTSGGPAPALRGASSSPALSHTVCTNILGIDYSGAGIYNPSLIPGFLAGLAAAILVAALTRRLLVRRRQHGGVGTA
jgi:hypothetical protein